MKYGILFSTVAALLTIAFIWHRGLYWLLLWPAFSFGAVASGYFFFGPRVYGKSINGRLSLSRIVLLFPYLLYLWSVWYFIRLVKRENAMDHLCDRIWIGRRLLSHEFPDHFEHVVDLTCEFTEPAAARAVDYYSFQILDGFVPNAEELNDWVHVVSQLEGDVFIHCAEGHGRTGLFAAALLTELNVANHVDAALEIVKSKRPLVRLGSRQLEALRQFGQSLEKNVDVS